MKIIVANIHLKEYMSSEFNSNFFFFTVNHILADTIYNREWDTV